ncbi:exported hypothetical protein [uncultured Mycobacterium sp.]|uniref:Uncharacterized protein n=1 Tax=uncultured Mycobacterium sp. TaxID=171292 RepID=A0A1Y5NZ16_9MYCO|nr:exported hypothetical protein [uncultured Mycobacterium sp.]
MITGSLAMVVVGQQISQKGIVLYSKARQRGLFGTALVCTGLALSAMGIGAGVANAAPPPPPPGQCPPNAPCPPPPR